MRTMASHFEEIEEGEFLHKVKEMARKIWGEIDSETRYFRTGKLIFVWPGLLPRVDEGEESPEVLLHECEDHLIENGFHLIGCYIGKPDNVCVIHTSTRI